MRTFPALILTLSLAGPLAPAAFGQGGAELLYSPDRFMQTPTLHPGFRLDAPVRPQASDQTEAAPKPDKPVTLRAGIVDDVSDEPGKIRSGEVTWALEKSVTGEWIARGAVRIGKASALELTLGRRDPSHGAIIMTVTTTQGLAFEAVSMATPRLRRTSAVEGEPLFGRVQRRGANQFAFELSDQAVDAENNNDRLFTRPWLDLIFRGKDGDEIIVTLEIGRSGADILKAAIE